MDPRFVPSPSILPAATNRVIDSHSSILDTQGHLRGHFPFLTMTLGSVLGEALVTICPAPLSQSAKPPQNRCNEIRQFQCSRITPIMPSDELCFLLFFIRVAFRSCSLLPRENIATTRCDAVRCGAVRRYTETYLGS